MNHLFDYVDPGNRKIQKEKEATFTDYLKLTGAYLKPRAKKTNPSDHSFPVEASIVIPVRNRKGTITEAIKSALAQKTDFPFNLIIIDNHSDDGTTNVIARVARQHPAIVHIIPERLDLGIGGCWNEAIYSGHAAVTPSSLIQTTFTAVPAPCNELSIFFGRGVLR